ncbi:hypothetical protein [Novosphingobium sp. FKTRR1]|uniref:hypothetical protein n=1 Tax=Novosphingobium sp. FKTRR1 TaxID=2879118 RepID=UPI001CF0623B|nr:hypothetical protein [Novosphingobium sp. FKTRR1]
MTDRTPQLPERPEVGRDDGRHDAAVDRALAQVAMPKVPPGLVARIVRDVPLLAQLPSDDQAQAPVVVSDHLGPKIIALPRELRPRRPVAAPGNGDSAQVLQAVPQGRSDRQRFLLTASGLGAMAAALVAVIALGLSVREADPVARSEDMPIAAITAPGAPVSVPAGAAPAAQVALGRDTGAGQVGKAPHAPEAVAAAAPPTGLPVAGSATAPAADPAHAPAASLPAPAQLAAGPVQGAPDDGSAAPGLTPLGTRGVMGPVLPQGYGYSGGGGLPEIPGNAPVRMSGGPGPGPGPGPGGPH